ncbi:MAG TPA: hypothetical protein VJ045_12065 [Hyphomicrobiaceae bacterium]|nr:hypothetical protein [Hyphomicrobiaceae bacterium]
MSEQRERGVPDWRRLLRWRGLVSPLGAVSGTLAAMALIYLGYDLVKGRLSPCESIFRETSVGLSTRVRFLRAEGELEIGRTALTELDERGQMAALNLKTCCTVLDAGRIDPEQFLTCKAKARDYEARVEDIVALVRTTMKDGAARAPAAEPAKAEQPRAAVVASLNEKVEAARSTSRDFNREVVEVRRAQALATLEAMPAAHVEVAAQEREPNDDPLSTNIVELDKWVTGSIGAAKDSDYYAFTTPGTHRDWIRVELQNQSATLEPSLELFDGEKSSLGSVHKTTKGADLAYSFVALPNTRFAVRASNYYGESTGVYLIRVAAAKAYDTHEPNDDILSARPIPLGAAAEAQIMDKNDIDFFAVDSGSGAGMMAVKIDNRSASLHPSVTVFDSSKTSIGEQHNTTAGGEVATTFKAQPGTTYFLRIADYYSDGAGDYALTVARQ